MSVNNSELVYNLKHTTNRANIDYNETEVELGSTSLSDVKCKLTIYEQYLINVNLA